MEEELPNTDIITLTRFESALDYYRRIFTHKINSDVLNEQFRLGPQVSGDLTLLLNAIQTTSKFIANNVRRARLINLFVGFKILIDSVLIYFTESALREKAMLQEISRRNLMFSPMTSWSMLCVRPERRLFLSQKSWKRPS